MLVMKESLMRYMRTTESVDSKVKRFTGTLPGKDTNFLPTEASNTQTISMTALERSLEFILIANDDCGDTVRGRMLLI